MPAKVSAYVLRMSVLQAMVDKYEDGPYPARLALPVGAMTGEPGNRIWVSKDQNYLPWTYTKRRTLSFGLASKPYLSTIAKAVCKLHGWHLPKH